MSETIFPNKSRYDVFCYGDEKPYQQQLPNPQGAWGSPAFEFVAPPALNGELRSNFSSCKADPENTKLEFSAPYAERRASSRDQEIGRLSVKEIFLSPEEALELK